MHLNITIFINLILMNNYIMDLTVIPKMSHKSVNMNHFKPVEKNKSYQLDIIIMRSDGGYQYIFALIDIHDSKAYTEPMKSKTVETVLRAFILIEKKAKLKCCDIMIDSGNEYKGKFKNYCVVKGYQLVQCRIGKLRQMSIVDSFS